MLGEHILENNPDCQMNKFGDLCNPPIISKKIDETKTRIHERYNSTDRSNNIALLRLKTKITLHSEDPVISIIAPVCLPWPDSYFGNDLSLYLKEGEDVRLTGWGKVTNRGISSKKTDRTLQQESLKISERTDCPNIQENQLCIGTRKSGGTTQSNPLKG